MNVAKSPQLDVWLPSWLASFLNIECTLKKRHIQGIFFPCLLGKVLICIRLSRVMTFNVINVTSIIPLTLSCLHLQNVNVSDYMTITRDPKKKEKRNTGLGSVCTPRAGSRVIHCHQFWNIFTRCQKHAHTSLHAHEHTHTWHMSPLLSPGTLVFL